ncbi:orotidine-5'-phosphate decarboxylase [Patescibacteria group bacterium]|nr:orotidine-5'-phosphate decarboxylase [Patescibacteria group bacterium]
MKELRPEERLIVAADYSPKDFGGTDGVEKMVLKLGHEIGNLGVYIKINSALRATGYGLIRELHNLGLKVLADLKLVDIPNTMKTDGEFLAEFKPEMLTVMCCAGIDGMNAVQKVVGENTEVLGVTILTSLNEEECQGIFTCSTKAGVLRFARMAKLAGLGSLILAPKEVEVVKDRFELMLRLNTPGVRPEWHIAGEDDQAKARILTPRKAILAGADRMVMGRPIVKADNPRDAVTRTLDEIEQALAELAKKGE